MSQILNLRGVHKSFVGVEALRGVDLEVERGQVHCLAGENGSGKSTLIKIVSGVHQPDAGTVELDGQVRDGITPIEAIKAGVQVIYQDFSIFPNLTVMENLALSSELAIGRRRADWGRFRRIAREAVDRIGVSLPLEETVGKLPVADKQLVAISRALMSDAKLIIMDEPTTALTSKEVSTLFGIISELKAEGISTLFVSHKLDEVFEISERFTIIRNGRTVATCAAGDLDRAAFTRHMTGRSLTESARPPAPGTDPILEVRGLRVEGALDDVSLSLSRGEVLGVTGLLGSGRTELALALFGAIKPDSGEVRLGGRTLRGGAIRSAIRAGMGYVPEDRLLEGLFWSLPIGENIVAATLGGFATKLGILDRRRAREVVSHWIEQLAIATPDPDNAVATLSGGNQQRVVLAKWLATRPEVLILNQPTAGVDVGSKHDIHEILRSLSDDGMAMIVISDDIPELLRVCHRVLVLRTGRVAHHLVAADTSESELASLVVEKSPSSEGEPT